MGLAILFGLVVIAARLWTSDLSAAETEDAIAV
jgi:hypothetical protein